MQHHESVSSRSGADSAGEPGLTRRRVGVLTLGLTAFGLLWLFVSVTHLLADPGQWGYYLMLLLGLAALAFAFHPIGRTRLSWPLPVLNAGEDAALQERASWVAGVSRGGTLVLTNSRLIFEPNSVEAALGLAPRSWAMSSIQAVRVAPRGLNLFGGAIRKRVQLVMRDGSRVLLVVRDAEEFRDRLAGLVEES